jgi:type VI secretion system protein ImpJ
MNPKIAWKEGLALLPHHFQRNDESYEARLHELAGTPASRGYGFLDVAFDEGLLAHGGQLSLRRCKGVFAGGTAFDAAWLPSALSRPIPPGLGTQFDALDLFVAMPMVSEMSPSLGAAGAPFLESFREVPDLASGKNLREIAVAIPNLSLRFGNESNDGFLLLFAGRLIRSPEGAPVFDGAVPTLLDIHAWEPLEAMFADLLGELSHRLADFDRRNPSNDAAGMRLWLEMLHLRVSLARLDHLKTCQEVHPERLYQELVALAGGLSATRVKAMPKPAYRHAEMSSCLMTIFEWLKSALAGTSQSRNVVKLMSREGPLVFAAAVDPGTFKRGSKVFLAIRTGLQQEAFYASFAQQVKVAPRSKLQPIILSALRGIEARPCQAPGFYLASGHCCLELVADATLWPALLEEDALGVYAPQTLGVTEIELLVEGE